MPFKKNDDKINRNGRPKGAKNKVSFDLRVKINDFLSENFDEILTEFKQLDPKDKVNYFIKLMEYSLPKLRSIEVEQPEQKNIGITVIVDSEDTKKELEKLGGVFNEDNTMTVDEVKTISNKLDEMY